MKKMSEFEKFDLMMEYYINEQEMTPFEEFDLMMSIIMINEKERL